jgi:D-alanyl-D-alanine carboxypeptidase
VKVYKKSSGLPTPPPQGETFIMLKKTFARAAIGALTGLAVLAAPVAAAPASAATVQPPATQGWQNNAGGLLGAGFVMVAAAKKKKTRRATKARPAYAPPHATLVMDFNTGQILSQSNADKPRHPASLTKVMTLMLVFDALRAGYLKPGQDLTVSAHAAAQSPVKLGLKAGSTIKLEDAIRLVATKSTNDMAVVLAEAVAGSEADFAKLMDQKALAIGMTDTHFTNASGLPDNAQVTTAIDMARMTRYLIRNYDSEYHTYIGQRSVQYGGRTYVSTNHLLGRYPGLDGVKTGFINASGFNLIASAERDGRRIIGIVFGGPSARSRDNEMIRLLDQGFRTRPVPVPTPRPVVRNDTATVVPGLKSFPATTVRDGQAATHSYVMSKPAIVHYG